jgi:hypothetical protein
MVASQIKSRKVADDRLRGGSRFNLRWSGSIPPDQKNPDAVMKPLADYVSFNVPQEAGPPLLQCKIMWAAILRFRQRLNSSGE